LNLPILSTERSEVIFGAGKSLDDGAVAFLDKPFADSDRLDALESVTRGP
jgi:FixJ family two-component response regulator